MTPADSRVTIHLAASLDGFIARRDGDVDWMEAAGHLAGGDLLSLESAAEPAEAVDCYLMGSHTYEAALALEARGMGWPYGEVPTVVLSRRDLRLTRSSVELHSGDLARLVERRLRPRFRAIRIAGGAAVAGECVRRGIADALHVSVLPVAIGDGIPLLGRLDRDVALHLREATAQRNGTVELRYDLRRAPAG